MSTPTWGPVVAERNDGSGYVELIAERYDGGGTWTEVAIERYGDAGDTPGPDPDGPPYEALDGSIVVPAGWGSTWWNYTAAQSASTRKAFVVYGDSTSFGSGTGPGANRSWTQYFRNRAIGDGYTDGGKGLFAGLEQELTYDPPEINGVPGEVTMGNPGDGFDTLVGAWFRSITAGQVQVTQFREDNLRLWYTKRYDGGEFTYSISTVADGVVASGTINTLEPGDAKPRFLWVPELPAGTKTLTVTNTGGGHLRFAVDGVNDTGLQVQKQAMSGMEFLGMFYGQIMPAAPYTAAHDGFRFQAPLGLVPNVSIQGGNNYAGMSVDTSYPTAARINPCLALTALGFNDLTSHAGQALTYWTEYVRRFAAACRAAGVAGIVATTQMPYNTNWYTHGPDRFNALKAEALAQGLAFIDMFYAIGGPSLDYAGGENNPHLPPSQYEAQADMLWDEFLSPASPVALAMAG